MVQLKRADWLLSGQPGLNGYESEDTGGLLSWGYATGIDCRFPGVVQLAPLFTALSFTASQGSTVTNTRAIGFSEGISTDTAELAVFACGSKLATVRLDTRAVTSDASASNFASAVTDLETTKSGAGTQEMSVCLASDIYQVLTGFATGAYTASANNESIINRYISKGNSYEADGQVFGLGQASGVENIVRHNVLDASSTMDASAWVTRATLGGPNITFTGFALDVDGGFQILGTTYGPYRFSNDFQVFTAMLPELQNSPSANLCKSMRAWSKLGVVIPLERETRLVVGLQSQSVGPERFVTNNTPVQGRVTAQGYSEQWGIWAIYNPVADATYLCWVRPSQRWEYHSNPVSIYPMVKLADGVDCEAIEWAGTKGSVANPTWYIGYDDDAQWCMEGRGSFHPSDTTCTYGTAGTIYLTTKRATSGKVMVPRFVSFFADGMSSTETITVTLAWVDKFGQSQSVALPAWIQDGVAMVKIPEEKAIHATQITPQIAMARGGTTTATPRIVREFMGAGDFTVWYEEEDLTDRDGRVFGVWP